MKIKTYGSQPIYKRKITEYKRLFIPEYSAVVKLNKKGIEVYRPKLNKLKVSIAGIGIFACICLPMTNWMIPGILIWGMK